MKNTSWFDKETRSFKVVNIISLQVMWIPAMVGLLLVSYAFSYATIANMNQGIIPSLFTLGSIYTLIISYLKFGETVSKM